jgi:hypothetical protein
MKIALCFSGHIRDLDETKVFWVDLIKKYDIDVYASFWDTENKELGDTINNFLTIYSPKKWEIERYDIFKKTTQDIASLHIESPKVLSQLFQETSKAFGQLSMYYKVWRCNLLTKELGIDYDLVIRARTDVALDNAFEIIYNDALNVPIGEVQSSFPYSKGLNDCFAYARPKIMDYYSFLYLQMMEYLNSGHYVFPPEHFLSVHFSKIKIPVRYFPNYMIITRRSKGTKYEIYNKFYYPPEEVIISTEDILIGNDPIGNFKKKSIKDDFIV